MTEPIVFQPEKPRKRVFQPEKPRVFQPSEPSSQLPPGYTYNEFGDPVPTPEQAVQEQLGEGFRQTIEGVKEIPRAIGRAPVNALNETLDLLATNPATIGLPEDVRKAASPLEAPQVPQPIAPPKTALGQAAETVATFAAPLVPLGKVSKPVKAFGRIIKGGRVAKATEKGVKAVDNLAVETGLAREPVQASEAATKAAEKITPDDILALRDVGRDVTPAKLAPRAEGQTVRTLSADDELAQVRANILEKSGGFREARRSGTTIEETRQAAKALGMTEEELLSKPIGTAYNREQLYAAEEIANKSAMRAQAIAQTVGKLEGEAKTKALERLVREYAIQEQVIAVRSESGGAQRILREAQKPNRELRRAIENIRKGDHTLEEQAALIATLDDPAQVMKFARNAKPATLRDKLLEFWVNSLLSGKALIVNPTSNSLVGMYTPLAVKPVQAAISRIPIVGGGETVYFREALAQINGMRRAMKVASQDATKIFLTEQVPETLRYTKIEAPIQQAIGGKTGKIVRTPGRILQSQDAWYKLVNAEGFKEALAVRDALNLGLKGEAFQKHVAEIVANPPQKIFDAAWKAADTATFTVPLKEQKGLTALVARLLQTGARESAAIRFFFPFVRTPTNIFKYGVANSPLAPILKDFRLDIIAGGAKRSEALARWAVGTAAAYTAFDLAAEGRITGGGPQDPNRRRTWRLTHEPYSIRIDKSLGRALGFLPEGMLKEKGGWLWLNYGRLEPLGMVVGGAADAYEISNNLTDKQKDKWGEGMALTLATVFARQGASKTFLSGATTLSKAADGEIESINDLAMLSAGSLIPSGVAELARANDPVVRDTRNMWDRMQSRIPFASKNLKPLQTLWGEDIVRGDPILNLFSPVYINPYKNDPVAKEMQRLGVSSSMPRGEIGGVELTDEQRYIYTKLAGQPAKRQLDKIVKGSRWKRLSDLAKERIITDMINTYRNAARNQMIARDPQLRAAVVQKRREGAGQ